MIFQRHRIHSASVGDFFRVQNQSTGKQLFGFSFGSSFAKLKDKDGSQWSGSIHADDNGGNTHMLRFRDANGQSMSGTADGQTVFLRDSRGHIWQGFVG